MSSLTLAAMTSLLVCGLGAVRRELTLLVSFVVAVLLMGGSSGFEWPCCVCLQTRLGPGPRQQGRQVQEAGFPPGTKWRAAAGRSAQAQRGRLGCLLSRARDGVPQQAWFPWLFAERMNDCICFRGRALREGTARRGGCRTTAAPSRAGNREESSFSR